MYSESLKCIRLGEKTLQNIIFHIPWNINTFKSSFSRHFNSRKDIIITELLFKMSNMKK